MYIFVYCISSLVRGFSCILAHLYMYYICDLWPLWNTSCLFLTWYQSRFYGSRSTHQSSVDRRQLAPATPVPVLVAVLSQSVRPPSSCRESRSSPGRSLARSQRGPAASQDRPARPARRPKPEIGPLSLRRQSRSIGVYPGNQSLLALLVSAARDSSPGAPPRPRYQPPLAFWDSPRGGLRQASSSPARNRPRSLLGIGLARPRLPSAAVLPVLCIG
jgi:hypothetical protein